MKKIIVAFVITAFAVASQAASLNWSMAAKVATESEAGSSMAGRASCYTTMVFLSSDLSAVKTALNGGTNVKYDALNSLVKSTFQASKTGQFSGLINNLDTDTASIFAVIFDTQAAGDTIETATHYQITDSVSQKTYGGTDVPTTAVFTAAEVHNSYTKIGSTGPNPPGPTPDVPEPTSGLLLAIGGAALALRRKQK